MTLLFSGFYYYFNRYGYDEEDPMEMAIRRIVTPLDAPKMMDLPQVRIQSIVNSEYFIYGIVVFSPGDLLLNF